MALQGSDNLLIDRSGVLYRIFGSDILAYVQANIGTSEYNVASVAARNALTGISVGDRVFVSDATGDATVATGWAIYVWMGAAWTKVAESEGLDVIAGGADLSYTPSATQGVVSSSTGTDATIPSANGSNAGLMTPATFTKIGFITVTGDVNLDALAGSSHGAVTLAGSTNTNPLTISGQSIGFSISQLTAAP